MKLQVMSVYDTKARAFLPPFFVPHVDVGLRAIASAANEPGHQLCRFAADFEIYHLGEWDDGTGVYEARPQPFAYGRVITLREVSTPFDDPTQRQLPGLSVNSTTQGE